MSKVLIKPIVIIVTLFASTLSANEKQNIDQQVWVPFIEGWLTMDAKKIIDVHSKDILRVMERDKRIIEGDAYLGSMKRMIGMMNKKGVSSKLEFRFNSRIVDGDYAWESGIYRAEMHHPERGINVAYAEFDVVLQKQDGHWKIKVDRDTPSTEDAFNAIK